MTHGSFFSGILGFDIASEAVGWENIFTCEKNDFCRKYINTISKNTFNHDDIDTFPFEKYSGTIDIISGGDPCQPHSISGLKKGKADDRYKWPKMFEGIEIIRPNWVVNENVIGTISNLVLDQKISDLESIGYTCQTYNIPAVAINADHERKRVFLVANTEGQRHKTICSNTKNSNKFNEPKKEVRQTIATVWNGLHNLRPVHYEQFTKSLDQPSFTISKDGLPDWADKRFLHAAGNLVCPGLAFILFNLINQIESR